METCVAGLCRHGRPPMPPRKFMAAGDSPRRKSPLAHLDEDEDEDACCGAKSCIVFEDEGDGWVDSGLVNEYGQPIMSFRGKDPIGFLWHDEDGALRPRHTLIGE